MASGILTSILTIVSVILFTVGIQYFQDNVNAIMNLYGDVTI